MRLQLGNLQGEARVKEINNWYDRETQLLQQKIDSESGDAATAYEKELALIGQQRDVLLAITHP